MEPHKQDVAAAGAVLERKRKPPRLTLADSALPLDVSLHSYAHPVAADSAAADREATTASEQSERPPASADARAVSSRESARLHPAAHNDAPPSAVAQFLSTLSGDGVASAPSSSSARPDTLDANGIGSRRQATEKFKKRGRVESANLDEHAFTRASSRSHAITLLQASAGNGASPVAAAPVGTMSSRTKRGLPRSHSTPALCSQVCRPSS